MSVFASECGLQFGPTLTVRYMERKTMAETIEWVFRWKENSIEVPRSRAMDKSTVWQFAIENLRPAGTSKEEGEKFVREYGEVVKYEP
jgi:hypothetical protein